MNPPEKMTRLVDSKRYDTQTATLLASDNYWDGINFERHGRNTFLYRTPKGAYFEVTLSQWQGEQDELTPINQQEAICLYESVLTEHHEEYEVAFPSVTVTEA